jgi:hypothetical protein
MNPPPPYDTDDFLIEFEGLWRNVTETITQLETKITAQNIIIKQLQGEKAMSEDMKARIRRTIERSRDNNERAVEEKAVCLIDLSLTKIGLKDVRSEIRFNDSMNKSVHKLLQQSEDKMLIANETLTEMEIIVKNARYFLRFLNYSSPC